MAGKMVRHDYLLAASSGVETGADIGVFSVRSPEAKMLDRQQQTNVALAEFLVQQSRMAGELSTIRGAAHDQICVAREVGSALRGDLRSIDHTLHAGFGQLDSSLRALDQTVYSGFQGLGYDVRSGFQSLAGVVAAAGDQVSATVGHVGARVDETLQRGFAETRCELRRQGAVGRAHSALLTAWLGDQLHQGFSHVCDGLRDVDQTLVRGFEDTSRTLREEHALDREAVTRIGADVITAIEDEGAATREAIEAAAAATIDTLRAEGRKDRLALAKNTKALTRTLERVIDHVERQGEIRARDHTAAAMRFVADGFHEEALTALGKALDECQGYFPAHYLRGMVAIQLRRPEDAERFFRMARAQAGSTSAAAHGREQALALLMLGRLAAHQGAWTQADTLFGDAANADDNLLMAHIEQAHAVLHNPSRGFDPQRTALVEKTLDGLPFAGRVLAWFGLALLLAERAPDDALGALRRGLTLDTRRLTHRRLHLYHALRSLYPALVPHLYAVVLAHAPDLAWAVSDDIKR